MRVVAIVGLAGSGKTEVARVFEARGFVRVRFGQVTDDEIRKRGLAMNESNERHIREQLRQELGMAAYAKLNLPKMDEALKTAHVVADGLYSWEEFTFLKDHYGAAFAVIAVWSAPETRYRRLAVRAVRPLNPQDARSRDVAEIEKTNKGGPIALADFMIVNEGTLEELRQRAREVAASLT